VIAGTLLGIAFWLTRQKGLFCPMSENSPRAVAGVTGFFHAQTLDKTMSDRKHLVSAEVDKLIVEIYVRH
jgi:hypothetical protein